MSSPKDAKRNLPVKTEGEFHQTVAAQALPIILRSLSVLRTYTLPFVLTISAYGFDVQAHIYS